MTMIAARRPTFAVIDAEALRHNLALLRATVAPPVGILAVVKADAYGHGARLVAPILEAAGVPGVQLGDEVVLWGCQQQGEIGVTEVAEWQGTVSYEVLTRVGKRVERVLDDGRR